MSNRRLYIRYCCVVQKMHKKQKIKSEVLELLQLERELTVLLRLKIDKQNITGKGELYAKNSQTQYNYLNINKIYHQF